MLRIAKIEDENYRLSVVETETELTPYWENLGYSLMKCEKAWDGNYYPIGRSPIEPAAHKAQQRIIELKTYLSQTGLYLHEISRGSRLARRIRGRNQATRGRPGRNQRIRAACWQLSGFKF